MLFCYVPLCWSYASIFLCSNIITLHPPLPSFLLSLPLFCSLSLRLVSLSTRISPYLVPLFGSSPSLYEFSPILASLPISRSLSRLVGSLFVAHLSFSILLSIWFFPNLALRTISELFLVSVVLEIGQLSWVSCYMLLFICDRRFIYALLCICLY